MTHAGLPHSDIDGSKLTSSSPSLFAGSRVLLRLLVPRHSLYALNNLKLRKIIFRFNFCFCNRSFYISVKPRLNRKNMLYIISSFQRTI